MEFSEGSSSEILGRLSSAYGVETQKQLAEKLGISAANVSNWVQRNSVPASAFVRCALDTGCDLAWLVTGGVANANPAPSSFAEKSAKETGKSLIKKMLSTGGRAVLKRVMDAYRFDTQKELSEYLGISTGTISTWVRREYFPGDIVIACALDTGVSLEWLSTGSKSLKYVLASEKGHSIIPGKLLRAGIMEDISEWVADMKLSTPDLIEPVYVESKNISWIVDFGVKEVSNGRWLLDVDGKYDIYDIVLIPGKKIIATTNNNIEFKCGAEEIKIIGHVVRTIEFHE